jgi:acetyl esterase/lipase
MVRGLFLEGMMLVKGLVCAAVLVAGGVVMAQVGAGPQGGATAAGPQGGAAAARPQRVPAPPAVMPANSPVPTLLWPAGAPGALGDTDADKPAIYAWLPASNPTKTGVIIAPGGSYEHLSVVREGSDVAAWLNAHGIAAFQLRYRLGPKYHNPIELGDAQRAIRLVRAHAAEYGIAPDHLGFWGFSAGGHLAGSAGVNFDAGNAASADPIEQQSSRPDFLVLSYAVITMETPYVHMGSRRSLLGDAPDPATVDAMSNELHVTAQTPPAFIYATTDDHTVPIMNAVMFYSALVKAGVPVEMHLFQHGAHGSALGTGNPQLSVWPDLLIKWMRERGYAAAAAPAAAAVASP